MVVKSPVPERSPAEDRTLRAELAALPTLALKLRFLRESILSPDGTRYSLQYIAEWCWEYSGRQRKFSRQWLNYLENGTRGKKPDELGIRALASFYRVEHDDLLPPVGQLTPDQRRIQSALAELGNIAVHTRPNPLGTGAPSDLDQASLAEILESVVRDVHRRTRHPEDPD